MKPNTILSSTEHYDLTVIQGTSGLGYGVVNKETGVIEYEEQRLPFATKGMTELEELLARWTPSVKEYNDDEDMVASMLLEESNVPA